MEKTGVTRVRPAAMRITLACALALPTLAPAMQVVGSPDTGLVAPVFSRAQQLCEAEGGRTWGVSLCGPMLIADPATRRVIANRDGVEVALDPDGSLFRGVLPDSVPIANTAVRWNGRQWTMLMLPLPPTEPAQSILLMHEAWHRIQDQIGLAAVHADQDQLATEQGRVALRLELRALAAALRADSAQQRQQAVQDALTFRAWRQARFAGAQSAEDAMERHEGIAEYTGRTASQDPAMIEHLADHLDRGDAIGEYARSFAYYTGPAYGVLLDRAAPGWRAGWAGQQGLPLLLGAALHIAAPADDAAFSASAQRHGGASVVSQESTRALQQRQRIALLQAKLVDAPVLVVPVSGASFSFHPGQVTPLPPQGAVYGVIRAAADWGVLEVAEDGLLSKDWSRLAVAHAGAARTPDGMKGNGWTLVLKPGWEAVPADREGDWTVRRRP